MAEPSVPSAGAMKQRKNNIDEMQARTVEEHFRIVLRNKDPIDSDRPLRTPEDLPEWFDEQLFQKGQNYYQRNMLSMTLVGMMGLLAVIAVPSILKVLQFTNQSGTPCTAFKRYLETILHIHTLYTEDVKDAKSNWWKSLNTIRWKHSITSERYKKQKKCAITQCEMALTQFGFIGYALLSAEKLSLTNEPQEREGLNHFWRVLGHMLGISERVNICRKSEEETTKLCQLLLDEVFMKHMKRCDEDFLHMSSVLIDGLWSIDMLLDFQAFMCLWFELSGLPYVEPMNTYSRLNALYRRMSLNLMAVPYIGDAARFGLNLYMKFNFWMARRYPIIARMRFGGEPIQLNLYPPLT